MRYNYYKSNNNSLGLRWLILMVAATACTYHVCAKQEKLIASRKTVLIAQVQKLDN